MRKNESTNPTSRTFPDQRSPLMRMSQGWMSLSCQRLDMYKFSPADSLIALDALLVNGSVKDLQDAMVRRHPGVQGPVPSGHQDSRDGDGKKPVFLVDTVRDMASISGLRFLQPRATRSRWTYSTQPARPTISCEKRGSGSRLGDQPRRRDGFAPELWLAAQPPLSTPASSARPIWRGWCWRYWARRGRDDAGCHDVRHGWGNDGPGWVGGCIGSRWGCWEILDFSRICCGR